MRPPRELFDTDIQCALPVSQDLILTKQQQEATASRQANIFNVRECLEELKQSVPDYMGIQERNH